MEIKINNQTYSKEKVLQTLEFLKTEYTECCQDVLNLLEMEKKEPTNFNTDMILEDIQDSKEDYNYTEDDFLHFMFVFESALNQ